MQLVASESDEGQLFANEERRLAETDTQHARSGIALARRIDTFGAAKSLTEAKTMLGKASAKYKILAGAMETKTKVTINNLIDVYNELPTKFRLALDLNEFIVSAIPDHVGESSRHTYKQRLQHEMNEHETIHGEPKYTPETLRNIIAERMANETDAGWQGPPSDHLTTNAAVAGTGGQQGNDARAKKYAGKDVTGTIGKVVNQKTGDSQFAFIKMDDGGDDIFTHEGNLEDGGKLIEGARVTFNIVYSPRNNKDKAVKVVYLPRSAAVANGEQEYDASSMGY